MSERGGGKVSGAHALGWGPMAFGRAVFDLGRPRVMAVVNVTPDSFSDGGRFAADRAGMIDSVVETALTWETAGCDLVDVGGASSRPGAQDVSVDEECARIVPVVRALARAVGLPITVDTTSAKVAQAALDAGAHGVNDISGGAFDADMVPLCAARGVPFILGHVRGASLHQVHAKDAVTTTFDDVVGDLAGRVAALPSDLRDRTWIDPGLGFGKGTALNLELVRRAGEMAARVGRPLVLGPSRKRFLGDITGRAVDARDDATIGAALAGFAAGAHMVRVHEPLGLLDALSVWRAVFGLGDMAPLGLTPGNAPMAADARQGLT